MENTGRAGKRRDSNGRRVVGGVSTDSRELHQEEPKKNVDD